MPQLCNSRDDERARALRRRVTAADPPWAYSPERVDTPPWIGVVGALVRVARSVGRDGHRTRDVLSVDVRAARVASRQAGAWI